MTVSPAEWRELRALLDRALDTTAEERARRGISDAMLRLSIGLEDAEDLIADLHQALG